MGFLSSGLFSALKLPAFSTHGISVLLGLSLPLSPFSSRPSTRHTSSYDLLRQLVSFRLALPFVFTSLFPHNFTTPLNQPCFPHYSNFFFFSFLLFYLFSLPLHLPGFSLCFLLLHHSVLIIVSFFYSIFLFNFSS